jgi:hypothetical protein
MVYIIVAIIVIDIANVVEPARVVITKKHIVQKLRINTTQPAKATTLRGGDDGRD